MSGNRKDAGNPSGFDDFVDHVNQIGEDSPTGELDRNAHILEIVASIQNHLSQYASSMIVKRIVAIKDGSCGSNSR